MNRIVTQKHAPSGTTIDLGVGTTPDFDYDDAANLRSHKIWNGTGTSTTTLTYKHDAWNRLVAVDFGGSVRAPGLQRPALAHLQGGRRGRIGNRSDSWARRCDRSGPAHVLRRDLAAA
jgi:hypothetical protein